MFVHLRAPGVVLSPAKSNADHCIAQKMRSSCKQDSWENLQVWKVTRKCKSETDYMTVCFTFVNSVYLNECFLVSRSTWHFEKLHSRSLHILSSSSPLPAHCSRHLVPRTSSSALLEHWLLHITRWKDHWRSRTLVRVAQKNR